VRPFNPPRVLVERLRFDEVPVRVSSSSAPADTASRTASLGFCALAADWLILHRLRPGGARSMTTCSRSYTTCATRDVHRNNSERLGRPRLPSPALCRRTSPARFTSCWLAVLLRLPPQTCVPLSGFPPSFVGGPSARGSDERARRESATACGLPFEQVDAKWLQHARFQSGYGWAKLLRVPYIVWGALR